MYIARRYSSGLSPARWRRPRRRLLRASPRDPVMLAPTPRAGWTALHAKTDCFNPRPARRAQPGVGPVDEKERGQRANPALQAPATVEKAGRRHRGRPAAG